MTIGILRVGPPVHVQMRILLSASSQSSRKVDFRCASQHCLCLPRTLSP